MLESLPAARDGIASGSAPSASLCSVSVSPADERAATPDPVSSTQALASCGFAEMEHGMAKETTYAASCFDVGDPVRLCYLKAAGLNGKCGVIVEPINNAGRYDVKLLAPKSILYKNLIKVPLIDPVAALSCASLTSFRSERAPL